MRSMRHPMPLRLRMAVLLIALTGAAGAMAGAAILLGQTTRHPGPRDPGPLVLSSVSSQVAGHYRFAAEHRGEFAQFRCWCGCEQFLGHRSLADCFERGDGRGWEAHAAGCGVCIGEAAMAADMIRAERPVGDVAAALDARFGPTVITTPPVRRSP